MTRLGLLTGLASIGIVMIAGAAFAAEGKTKAWRYNGHSSELPFSRGELAQSVWASDRCWRECGAYCAW